jgi:hypothetical protein
VKDFLRQSQVLTTFGPGAMVDLPDRAVLIEGLQAGRFSVPGAMSTVRASMPEATVDEDAETATGKH